jgi:PAS domain S-box-containing protein
MNYYIISIKSFAPMEFAPKFPIEVGEEFRDMNRISGFGIVSREFRISDVKGLYRPALNSAFRGLIAESPPKTIVQTESHRYNKIGLGKPATMKDEKTSPAESPLLRPPLDDIKESPPDTAKRKETERFLEERNAQLLSMIEAISDIVYFKDLDRRNLLVNAAFERAFGLGRSEIQGKKDEEFLPLDLAESCRRSDEAVLKSGRTLRFEERMTGPDGREIVYETIKTPLIDPDKRGLGLVGVSRDMTARRQTEDALRDSEERFRSLFEHANDAVFLIDLNGVHIRINKKAADMTGYDTEDLVGKTTHDIVAPGEHAEADHKLQGLIEGQTFPLYERTFRKKDGTEFPVEINVALIRDGEGRPLCVQSIVRDITDRKRKERALRTALLEKEILLKEVHHRVKNNMQVVSSLLSLQKQFINDPALSEVLRESQRRIKSMSLVHEKLYQSRDLSQVAFSDYIHSLVAHLVVSQQIQEDRIKVHFDLEDLFFDIQTAVPCGLIINELVSNAFKHAFPKNRPGEISIRLKRLAGDSFLLAVKDNGVGLPDGFSIEVSQTMGMQLITLLSEQLEGRIEIDRSDGTEFRLTLKDLRYPRRL